MMKTFARRATVTLAGVLSVFLAGGCGGAAEQPGPSSEDGADKDDPGPPGIIGAVQLVEIVVPSMQMGMTDASADFLYFDPRWLDDDEPPQTDEPCRVVLTEASEPEPPEPVPLRPNVGAIAVQGGAADVYLQYRNGLYDAAMAEGVVNLFDEGDVVSALGAGNEETGAEEFEVEVTAPADLVVTIPNTDSIAANADRVIEWQPGSVATEIEIALQSQSADGQRSGAVFCQAADDDGSLTIGQALLAQLPTGEARLEIDRVARGFQRDGPMATNLYAIVANIWLLTLN
jgi:hypothetical protein